MMPDTKLSEQSLALISHIASRGIGLSLYSEKNGWISDQRLARAVLADAGYSEAEISALARKHDLIGDLAYEH